MERIIELIKLKKIQIIILVLFSILSSVLVYIQIKDWSLIVRYWDGPNYMEVAKTLYNVPENHPFTPYGTTPAYFACHLPLYPFFIRIFSFMTYPVAMIFTTLLFSALATVAFYFFLIEYKCVKSPFYSALIATFLPVRWLIYSSVGATEPVFIFWILLSLIAYKRDKMVWAMMFASLASITRIVGVLMAVVFFIEFIRTKRYKLIPLTAIVGIPLFLTFVFYHFQYGDFFAYFSWNSKLLNGNPMQIFYNYAGNGATHSSELYFLFYILYGAGVLFLWQYPVLFTYSAVYYVFNLFVFHEDVSRYFLVITHFAFIIAYDNIFNTKQFKIIAVLAFYLAVSYTALLIPHNVVDAGVYQEFIRQPSYP